MIHLGTQYYRPPFPNAKYWDDDLARMKDAGLNTVQLWVKWGWVEPEPEEFRFDDYDRLVERADGHGLGVVLSTIAAIHPYWIHRVVPDSEMIDNFGHKIVSANRQECHNGLTPGGCLDHPGVWERMSKFLAATVERFRGAPNLVGWDAWNELRWSRNADALVCFCPHTLQAFRGWLDRTYGGLDGLNAAWQRRYAAWEDVRPGKMPRSPYTEMMAFQHFITWRANRHGRARYDLIKGLDPDRPVTVHGGQPAILRSGAYPDATALWRGNDWDYADHLDGIGTSSFPFWGGFDHEDYTARIDFVAAAARGKRIWLSELQGGRAAQGFQVHVPVPPASQQRWIWTGIAAGAEAILFWCWRDEVFGRESAGFGIAGNDGHAAERLDALKKTSGVLTDHADLLDAYRPDAAEVGIYFSPQAYYLHWTQEGTGRTPQRAIQGYARALVRRSIPYTVVEEEHLGALDGLKALFLPRAIVLDPPAAEALAAFVRGGGTLFCESECGAFGRNGLYRYPEDRFVAELTGVLEAGRRTLEGRAVSVELDGAAFELPATQWLTPLVTDAGEVTLADVPVGDGRVLLCSGYFGDAYFAGSSQDDADLAPYGDGFERFLEAVVRRAGVVPPVEVIESAPASDMAVHVKLGSSAGRRVAFVFGRPWETVRLRFAPGTFRGPVHELITGDAVELIDVPDGQDCAPGASDWGVAVLVADG